MDKAIVEAVARAIAPCFDKLDFPKEYVRGQARRAINAYEAAKEATIQKAADELVTGMLVADENIPDGEAHIRVGGETVGKITNLVHVEEYTYLDGDVDLDHIQDWYMN